MKREKGTRSRKDCGRASVRTSVGHGGEGHFRIRICECAGMRVGERMGVLGRACRISRTVPAAPTTATSVGVCLSRRLLPRLHPPAKAETAVPDQTSQRSNVFDFSGAPIPTLGGDSATAFSVITRGVQPPGSRTRLPLKIANLVSIGDPRSENLGNVALILACAADLPCGREATCTRCGVMERLPHWL